MAKTDYGLVKEHLRVLKDRSRKLGELIKRRRKAGQYNQTEMKRILTKIKSAKKNIADAEYI